MAGLKTYDREKIVFLDALAKGATVAAAAKASGVARRTWYDVKDREPAFADAWEYAIKDAHEDLLSKAEIELHARAFDRDDAKSYILLIFLLKKLNPEYKEHYKSESKIVHETVHTVDISQKDIDEAVEILTKAKSDATQP